ncbi:hypothetical protein CBOM_07085 [Ceraceosorus bombacis]|uniref:Uncharacterized protein n=1 Tax=Ceraceosorus bombacis TaxID=401625 RepID=A0A0P1A3V0_9BASI|nr:hypothetical protein CBOM_07085 [Ceraceosorus bombacis]
MSYLWRAYTPIFSTPEGDFGAQASSISLLEKGLPYNAVAADSVFGLGWCFYIDTIHRLQPSS